MADVVFLSSVLNLFAFLSDGGAEGLRSRHHRGGGGRQDGDHGGGAKRMRVDVAAPQISADFDSKPRTMAIHNFVYDDSHTSSAYQNKQSRRNHQKAARRQQEQEEEADGAAPEPRFHPDMKRNVTVQLGGMAYLACQVVNPSNYTVRYMNMRANK